MALAHVEEHRWTRRDYERLAAQGFFRPGQRVELIEGVIYDRAPQNSHHSTAFRLAQEALRTVFPPEAGYEIRGQLPLALGEDSEPEPDLAVVTGGIRDYLHHHPTTALLVVEIADSSLLHDRKRKIPLYARSGIPEAWQIRDLERGLRAGERQDRTARAQDEPGLIDPVHRIAIDLERPADQIAECPDLAQWKLPLSDRKLPL
jgi:Putative restriction endonuclease